MAESVLEGAKELLFETISTLSSAGVNDYIVIGGWCPYFLNTSEMAHPGTLDVDLLFRDGSRDGALGRSIKALRQKGFIPSAKHGFQLLLEKQIGAERLIYNVDLLHPQMSETDKNMFVDHLDLDVPLDEYKRQVKKVKSIVQKNSLVLFEESLYVKSPIPEAEFNLVDFTGMFITKMDSCKSEKRARDSFDIYLGFKSGLVDFDKLKAIKLRNNRVAESLEGFATFLRDKAEKFDKNVFEFSQPPEVSPAMYVQQILCAGL